MVTWVGGGRDWEEAWGVFWGDDGVLSLDRGLSDTGAGICPNSLILKIRVSLRSGHFLYINFTLKKR